MAKETAQAPSELHAAAVRSACDALNDAVTAATGDGLLVRVDVLDFWEIAKPTAIQRVTVEISKLL